MTPRDRSSLKSFVIGIPLVLLSATASGQPGPDDLGGLQAVGRIDATPGQVIDSVEVSNPKGPCIVVPNGVTNVIVRNSRIGPCGPAGMSDYGVLILEGAANVAVLGNVIHDVGSGVKAYKAIGPLVIDRNFFYNIRGPLYNGQAVQFNGVTAGEVRSRVTCNVSDANYGIGKKSYEDHISMYASIGSESSPIEIAYNRVRGGTSKTGGGITVGDKGGGWIYVHDNVVVTVANSGIGVAGGHDIRIENNRVDNRGDDIRSLTHVAYFIRGISECRNITMKGNRGIARLWNWKEERGDLIPGYRRQEKQQCENVNDSDNMFGDTTLSPKMFDIKPAACN